MSKVCPKCGKIVSDDMSFCMDCGTALECAETAEPAQDAVVNTVDVVEEAAETNAAVSSSPEYSNANAPVFSEQRVVQSPDITGKAMHIPSLVLGIISVIFAFMSPVIAWICGIIGVVLAVKKRNECRTTAGLVLSIIGIVLGLIIFILGMVVVLNSPGLLN